MRKKRPEKRECDTCHHWEWDDGKHGFMSGYCPIFDKLTHKDDGAKCTAWQKIHLENTDLSGGVSPSRSKDWFKQEGN